MHLSSIFSTKVNAVFKRMAATIGDHDRPQLNANGDMDCFHLMKPKAQPLTERQNGTGNHHTFNHPPDKAAATASTRKPGESKPRNTKVPEGLQITHQPDFFGFSPDLVRKHK